MKIAVVGIGYVGLSLACLFAKQHDVIAVDIDEEKVNLVNRGVSPLIDPDIEAALASHTLKLTATTNVADAISDTQLLILAVPTDYNAQISAFDTRAVESVLDALEAQSYPGTVVIRSTVPVGYTHNQADLRPQLRLLFSPEFLQEGQALYDNLHPSRIIVGVPRNDADTASAARKFATLLEDCADEPSVPTRIMNSSEAEAVKLFSNTYLALRVSFFNELDTFAMQTGLNTADIIEGVGLDSRIGNHYNNPSFGYGGYCLPKDSKQLLSAYDRETQKLIEAIVSSNATRKDFIAADIAAKNPQQVGVFRLAMKKGSDNYRHSSILGIMERLAARGISMLVYDPACPEDEVVGAKVTDDLETFKQTCDLIICNRYEDALADVADKVYTRDSAFGEVPYE